MFGLLSLAAWHRRIRNIRYLRNRRTEGPPWGAAKFELLELKHPVSLRVKVCRTFSEVGSVALSAECRTISSG